MFNIDQFKQYKKKIKKEVDNQTISLLILGAVLIPLSALAILAIEKGKKFKTYGDALWWAIVTTTTVGYGDIYPETFAGRVIAILLMTLGIGTFGGLTAKLADIFIASKRRKERGEVPAEYKDHLVICGWNKKAKEIINQILNEEVEDKQIVLVANIDRDPFPDNELIHFIAGKMEEKEILEKAGIKKARAAIVLNINENDARTVLTILNIENLNSNIYTIAEISEKKHEIHLENANIDEIIVDNDINSQLLVRSALYGGTSRVIKDLLSNEQGNEIYMAKVSKEEGRAFFDIFTEYKQEEDMILIGIKRGKKILTNPENDETIQAGDALIYIAADKYK